LKRLINEFNAPITKFECDQGTEFSKFKIFCKENNILFKYKYGANKANFAENIIQVIKRRLYKLLRGTLSKDWPNALKKVVTDFNNTPLKKIGFLKPNEISSKYDSKKVRDALKSQNQQLKDEPNYSELQKNQKNFSSAKGEKLHLGDYVYVNFPESKFGKSFDFQVKFLREQVFVHSLFSPVCMLYTTNYNSFSPTYLPTSSKKYLKPPSLLSPKEQK